ncbi:MAG TPA: hypothetical protein VJH55_01085 [Candidatus Paceibacterota bacterium]
MRKTLPPFIAALVVLIAVLHYAAIVFYLYWAYWWFDIMMHVLGGMAVGLLLYWFLYRSAIVSIPRLPSWGVVLVGTIVVGVGWEIFEYVIHLTYTNKESYVFDTSVDLLMDVVGAYGAYVATRLKLL